MQLVPADHPALTSVAYDVADGEDVVELVKAMKDIMHTHRGIGLAANQLGVLKRVITLAVGDWHQTIVNPVIVKAYGMKKVKQEGCLSFPGRLVTVVRRERIIIKGRTVGGRPVLHMLSGMEARAVQHEIDHLNGVTLVGRLKTG